MPGFLINIANMHFKPEIQEDVPDNTIILNNESYLKILANMQLELDKHQENALDRINKITEDIKELNKLIDTLNSEK